MIRNSTSASHEGKEFLRRPGELVQPKVSHSVIAADEGNKAVLNDHRHCVALRGADTGVVGHSPTEPPQQPVYVRSCLASALMADFMRGVHSAAWTSSPRMVSGQ